MKKINEIFYSIQGEGYNAGRAAVFIRFSGCNIRCPFCDTKHQKGKEMSDLEIINQIAEYPCRFVILTGGEPTLYIDADFVDKLHHKGYEVAIETNGTNIVPANVDFVTLSPKFEFVKNSNIKQLVCNELKVIFNSVNNMDAYNVITAKYKYIQPCDTGDDDTNQMHIVNAIKFVQDNPDWRLSLQLQKILSIR